MSMDDIYHTARWYVRGAIDDDAVVADIRSIWGAEQAARPGGPLERLGFAATPDWPTLDYTVERLGGPADAVFWLGNERPRDDEARACWGPAAGCVVDKLLDLANLEAWLLESDEGHAVGVWKPDGVVVNSIVGMEGWSMREPLALMLIDRFEARNVAFEVADLGDLPGGYPAPM